MACTAATLHVVEQVPSTRYVQFVGVHDPLEYGARSLPHVEGLSIHAQVELHGLNPAIFVNIKMLAVRYCDVSARLYPAGLS